MLLIINLLTKKWDSFDGPLGIEGILFLREPSIIEKQVENLIKKTSIKLNKEASRKINKDVLFLNLVLFYEHL